MRVRTSLDGRFNVATSAAAAFQTRRGSTAACIFGALNADRVRDRGRTQRSREWRGAAIDLEQQQQQRQRCTEESRERRTSSAAA